METLDQLKKEWNTTSIATAKQDESTMKKIIKSRVNKHLRSSMQYFWASFTLQILVYALLFHVIIRYNSQPDILLPGIAGILFYIPFTIMVMRKFKRMAITNPNGTTTSSIYDYISKQRELLISFFTFKKRYEFFLIPVSACIGVLLTFTLYVPGGVTSYPNGAVITLIITLASCFIAIRTENRKIFKQPIEELNNILAEYEVAQVQES